MWTAPFTAPASFSSHPTKLACAQQLAQFGEDPILPKAQMGCAVNGSLDKCPFFPSTKPWVCLSCTLVIAATSLFH